MQAKVVGLAVALIALAPGAVAQGAHDELIAKHAIANDVPESLVRRIIKVESRGNPRIVYKGNYGLMQIRLGTARAMGYDGGPEGLLDADTNMKYAVKYLAGAYRAAGCDHDRAVVYYQRGYGHAGKIKCGQQAQFVIAQAVSKTPRAERDTTPEKSATKSLLEKGLPSSTRVLRPKVVQTLPISARAPEGATSMAQPSQPEAAPIDAEPKPDTFEDRMMASTGGMPATTGARVNFEPEEIPALQTKRSDRPASHQRESKPAHPRAKAHASSAKQPTTEEADASSKLISFLKNLVTSDTKTSTRKQKAAVQAVH